MRTARRFVGDESGMTLALAMIMIVIIGAMGAGLLAFVNRDLVTVVEENRGQRAFEVADAGIEAAKRQLASNVDRTKYDDPTNAPVDDVQWSIARGGLTLNDLDGNATTSDSVKVTIQYRGGLTDDFKVISTGTYGSSPQQAKRKIEAVFIGVQAGAGAGDQIGHPVYYTKSDIQILQDNQANNAVTLNQVSMFALGNILIPNHTSYPVTSRTQFTTDWGDPQGSFTKQGNDELCDWNSKTPVANGCFDNGTQGNWNTIGRPDQLPGMAATGKIRCYNASTPAPSGCDPTASIADGVHGFDSTTTPRFVIKDCQTNNLPTCPDNVSGTISPPFPLPTPLPAGFKAASCKPPGTPAVCTQTPPPISYFVGNPNTTDPKWGLDTSNASNNRITFVDAQNKTLRFDPSGGRYKGIILVWCGRLEMHHDFEGIIMNLVGSGLAGNTSCDKFTPTVNASTGVADGKSDGTYVNQGYTCQCWVYAEGGTSSLARIQIEPASTVQFRPSSDWNYQEGLFQGPPPTDFKLQSWRECTSNTFGVCRP